ncbi:MAG: serine protease [Candidatus Symbiothrix sp.]|jgi:membrane protein implicated in regulation of membrane protease activity|nr:serine protease [Candidatus Symbiothrix sp.]
MEWFMSLEPVLRIYWMIAGVASLIFVIQMIMTFVGMDTSDGLDADFSGDAHVDAPFQFFSLRNLVNFFLGFGWSGVCFFDLFETKLWVAAIAILIGIAFVALFFLIVRQFLKLQEDNTFRIESTLGQTASVYLVIPAAKSGKGKIQISVKGAFHEIDAQTEGERIPTGAIIRVTKLIDNQTVMVTKI